MIEGIKLAITVVGAFISAAAAVIALQAWRVGKKTLERDHRPVIRAVAAAQDWKTIGLVEADERTFMQLEGVLLKNVGRAPGLSVVAFDPLNRAVIGSVDAVEPLGPGAKERNRLGRVAMPMDPPMRHGDTYELFYQDLLASWHLTRFRPLRGPLADHIQCTFVGLVKDDKVPAEVRNLGTVARP